MVHIVSVCVTYLRFKVVVTIDFFVVSEVIAYFIAPVTTVKFTVNDAVIHKAASDVFVCIIGSLTCATYIVSVPFVSSTFDLDICFIVTLTFFHFGFTLAIVKFAFTVSATKFIIAVASESFVAFVTSKQSTTSIAEAQD